MRGSNLRSACFRCKRGGIHEYHKEDSEGCKETRSEERNEINMRRWEPMRSVLEAGDARKFGRFPGETSYKTSGSDKGKEWNSWQAAEMVAPHPPHHIKGVICAAHISSGRKKGKAEGASGKNNGRAQRGGDLTFAQK